MGTAGRTAGSLKKGQMLFDEGAISTSAYTLAACSAGDLQLQCLGSTAGTLHGTDAALPFLWSLEDRLSQSTPELSGTSTPGWLLQGDTLEHVSVWALLLSSPWEQGCLCHPGAVL